MKEYIVLVDESTLEQDELEWFKGQGAKELIRCEDCIHKNSPKIGVMFCKHIHKFVDGNWFCGDGERR